MAKAAQAPKSIASSLPSPPERRGRRPTATGAAKETRSPNDLESEPTEEQMAAEEQLVRKEASRAAPAKDLLASYMEQLSRIPLFTPERELEAARSLEAMELHTWQLILLQPRGVEVLILEGEELEKSLSQGLHKLYSSYKNSRSKDAGKPGATPTRQALVDEQARELRFADFDKQLLDLVMQRLRRQVWGRSRKAFHLSHGELTEIEQARGASLRARNNFVRANLRLVVSVARNFHHLRIPFIDLIQEGNVGLMKAVHRFDHSRGFRFSTYAHWWIRQSIERAIINKGSQVRLPVHIIDSRRQINRANARLTQRLGRTPTTGEISQTLKMSKKKVEEIIGGVHQDPVSLDEAVSNDDMRPFMDLVRDHETPAIDEAVIRENTHDRLIELMQLLNPIERDIISRRFGLGNDSDQTLDEIGKQYDLSRERVRQIQAQGLMKMRRMCDRRQISRN